MGTRTSYTPGTFSWTDLSTSDPDDAKRFYTELFGWEYEDMPVPNSPPYTMFRKNGHDVAALSPAQEGAPTAWNSYVTVESADSTAGKANDLGGTLIAEPFDVMDAGRMTVIQDPTGAFFSAWEPRENIGAKLVNEPGALSLNQLTTPDPERARPFYAGLFGWRIEQVEGTETPYWGIYVGDRLNAGMMRPPPDNPAPPHWLVYFGSESVDDDAGRITELGGQIMLPPMDVPGGRITIAQDPQGGVFALVAGRFDD
jgi:uncharacterized protein